MRRPAPFHAALAALLAACVLLLGLAGVSPRLHEHLCHHEHPRAEPRGHGGLAKVWHHHHHGATADDAAPPGEAHSDHSCAVTLFASGCETPLAFDFCPPAALHAEGVACFTELLLSRTLRGPQRVCGPPARA